MIKRMWLPLVMAAIIAGCLLMGCKSTDAIQLPNKEETSNDESDMSFSFADISNLEFWFGSGAGAWRTVLTVREDGAFEGEYLDSDMDVRYVCNFTGKLTEPVKLDDYTYSIQLEQLEFEREPNTQESKDGITYMYSDAYGLNDADELLFYLPGTPVDRLSEECLNWMRGFGDGIDTELPFYGLYNVAGEMGFSSREKNTIDKRLAHLEQEDVYLMDLLETQASLTQAEMNNIAEQRYHLWDSELNLIWKQLKETLDVTTMEMLTVEEREWIAYKEAEMKKSGLEVEGGSLQPVFEYGKGRELTRIRVYELAEYLR